MFYGRKDHKKTEQLGEVVKFQQTGKQVPGRKYILEEKTVAIRGGVSSNINTGIHTLSKKSLSNKCIPIHLLLKLFLDKGRSLQTFKESRKGGVNQI